MVDSYRTEEEQIAAIKNWWKKNGNSILIGIGLALAIIFGWQYWQQQQVNEATAAANRFQELVQVIGQESDDGQNAGLIAEDLREEHTSSPYAIFATLLQAKTLVQQGKPDEAVPLLEWALEHSGAAPMPLAIREQLARAQYAAGDLDGALATLQSEQDAGTFTPIYKELEGDIHKARGDVEAARTAYKAAAEAGGGVDRVLELKLDDLATVEAS